ncbi:MAG: host-nuclease inhibitor Gam family protein [Symbiopectobacterium sp.]
MVQVGTGWCIAFDDDLDFQENMEAHVRYIVRYMVEVIARHQLNIEEEQ